MAKKSGKSLQHRIALMKQGVEALEQWLFDLVQQGLSTLENQPPDFWERFAASMTDAKLSGIAKRIRQWPALLEQADWHERLLEELAECYLFVQTFRQLDSLPPKMQEDALSLGGYSHRKEYLLAQDGMRDNWLVIGQIDGKEEKLRFRRTWLWGERSGQAALLLDYAFGNNPFEKQWRVGSATQAELVFYPSNYPMRALPKEAVPYSQPLEQLSGYPDLQAFADAYARALSQNPFLFSFPALLEEAEPVLEQGQARLADRKGLSLPTAPEDRVSWRLIAGGAGQQHALFGEWDGRHFYPLSLLRGGQVIPLRAASKLDAQEDEQ